MEDFESLMQERPDGITPLVEDLSDGFIITDPDHPERSGMVAHRGVLFTSEYVDPDVLAAAVEEQLGYTYAEVSAVYKVGGKLTPSQREFRTYIDARLLALSSSGANMEAVAVALGLGRATVYRAIDRAKLLHVEPQVKNPAVVRPCMCFICTSMNARPRKRRFSTSPPKYVGTIDLCPVDYSRGFETRPGNARYWQFRARCGR